MSELLVTIPTPHGDVTLTISQATSMGKCIEYLRFQGKEAVWHPADCGCCIIVHEDGVEPCHAGFVIGQDGGYDWVGTEKTEGSDGESG